MMTVCRLCLVESPDVIHIFRELGVQLKVSSILSKHFGSLFEVTEEHDEAICSSCWTHTESFHAFYQSIKSAQNCYSSDEEDNSNALTDPNQSHHQHHQQQQLPQQLHHHPQNVKLVMYDSVTGQVIEQRPNDHHYHITYNNDNGGHHQQQPHDGSSSSQMHGVIEQDTYEVCDETTDSDLELLMMMQPNDANNSVHQAQQHQHNQQLLQQHQPQLDPLHQPDEQIIQIGDDDDDDASSRAIDGTASSMAPILHIRDRSGGQMSNDVDDSVSEFLQSNEHITVIEVSSPSQAQKLLQQQQLQQQQHIAHNPLPMLTTKPGVANVKAKRQPVARKRKLLGSPANLLPTNNPATIQQQLHHQPPPLHQHQQQPPPPLQHQSPTIAFSSTATSMPMITDDDDDDNTASSTMGGGAGGEPYRMQCDLCSKTFKTFHRVQSHYQQKHNMDGYVMCCGDQFFEKDLLVDHILMHVNNRRQMKKISCAHCEQFFYRKRFYTRHLLKVHNITVNGNTSAARNDSLNSSANSTASSSATPNATPQRTPKVDASPSLSATATTSVTLGHTTYIITAAPQPANNSQARPTTVSGGGGLMASKSALPKYSGTPLKTVISGRGGGNMSNQDVQPDDDLLVLS